MTKTCVFKAVGAANEKSVAPLRIRSKEPFDDIVNGLFGHRKKASKETLKTKNA